jgi:hypothetical protein
MKEARHKGVCVASVPNTEAKSSAIFKKKKEKENIMLFSTVSGTGSTGESVMHTSSPRA